MGVWEDSKCVRNLPTFILVPTDVCFFRMDFEQFTLKGPADSIETNGGVCTDTMTVTVNSGQKIPTICGQNTGQHSESQH